MLSRVTFSCLFVLLLSQAPVEAQSVEAAIETVNSSRTANCKATPVAITNLIQAIRSSSSPGQQAKGLQFLSNETFWKAENQQKAFGNLVWVGKQSDSLELLASRALINASGELNWAILKYSDNPSEFENYLRRLIENNDQRNGYYQNIARLTLAETLQDQLFRAMQDQPVPITKMEAGQASAIEEIVVLYKDVKSFYQNRRSSAQIVSRDYSLDFDYQVALLKFVFGIEGWKELLSEITKEEASKDAYDRQQEARHVFVYSFLRPPFFVVAAAIDDDSIAPPLSCSPKVDSVAGSEEVNVFSPALVRKFFNPVQLAHWTCSVLSQHETGGLAELTNKLARFENRDYRIVLGHFRGKEVRFSFLSKDELIAAAKELEDTLIARFSLSDTQLLKSSEVCGFLEGKEQLVSDLNMGIQSISSNDGYVYLGSFLSYTDAKKVLGEVKTIQDFRGAYLLRPKID